MALKDIKQKIAATNRMHKVTRAMEAVSAVKMRKSQLSAFASRPFAHTAVSILARVSGVGHFADHVYLRERPVKRVALVVMTSDKGLAGSLNSGVLKQAEKSVSLIDKAQVEVYAVGKKAGDYFLRRGYTVVYNELNKADDVDTKALHVLIRALLHSFRKSEIDEVRVVYSNFKSTFEQIPTERILLPLTLHTAKTIISDITPIKGKWSNNTDIITPEHYTVESGGQHVLDVIIPKLIEALLFHLLLEGKASEHSARMVAMKNARDKSKEVSKDLTRLYNKIRQAAITREVSEIVGGREALRAE